jgi:hypothetical protein
MRLFICLTCLPSVYLEYGVATRLKRLRKTYRPVTAAMHSRVSTLDVNDHLSEAGTGERETCSMNADAKRIGKPRLNDFKEAGIWNGPRVVSWARLERGGEVGESNKMIVGAV